MIALTEAMEIAEVFAPGAAFAEERRDAFIFRGTDALPVIILKRNGRIVPEWQFERMRKEKKRNG